MSIDSVTLIRKLNFFYTRRLPVFDIELGKTSIKLVMLLKQLGIIFDFKFISFRKGVFSRKTPLSVNHLFKVASLHQRFKVRVYLVPFNRGINKKVYYAYKPFAELKLLLSAGKPMFYRSVSLLK